ncbi:hypothetical protein GCM10023165_28020 [Variovorax defluvii]|uniref:Uncharacterized protein n=1 Tax=Variovorax defluvii TaxID=913761 RepID=A0ABP8HUD1_9BURK
MGVKAKRPNPIATASATMQAIAARQAWHRSLRVIDIRNVSSLPDQPSAAATSFCV